RLHRPDRDRPLFTGGAALSCLRKHHPGLPAARLIVQPLLGPALLSSSAPMPSFFSTLRRRAVRCLLTALLAGAALPARADIVVQIEGVEGELRNNILIFLSVERYRAR